MRVRVRARRGAWGGRGAVLARGDAQTLDRGRGRLGEGHGGGGDGRVAHVHPVQERALGLVLRRRPLARGLLKVAVDVKVVALHEAVVRGGDGAQDDGVGDVDAQRDERHRAARAPHHARHEGEQRHRELGPHEQGVRPGELDVVGRGVLVGEAERVGRGDAQHEQLERRGRAGGHRGAGHCVAELGLESSPPGGGKHADPFRGVCSHNLVRPLLYYMLQHSLHQPRTLQGVPTFLASQPCTLQGRKVLGEL